MTDFFDHAGRFVYFSDMKKAEDGAICTLLNIYILLKYRYKVSGQELGSAPGKTIRGCAANNNNKGEY